MEKLMRIIDVMNAFKLCAVLAVVDVVWFAVMKIREKKGHNQRELPNTDSDSVLLHGRCGDRCGNNRRNTPHTVEEKVMALNTFRVGATWFEKCVLDEISDDLIELDAIKFLRENENDS